MYQGPRSKEEGRPTCPRGKPGGSIKYEGAGLEPWNDDDFLDQYMLMKSLAVSARKKYSKVIYAEMIQEPSLISRL